MGAPYAWTACPYLRYGGCGVEVGFRRTYRRLVSCRAQSCVRLVNALMMDMIAVSKDEVTPANGPATHGQAHETRIVDQAPGAGRQRTHRIELSPTQVIGGALAAMTAATIGSQLGLAGTILGAASASVIATIATAVYTTSLRRTQDRVRVVIGSGPRRPAGAHRYVGTPSTRTLPFARLRWRPVLAMAGMAFVLASVGLTSFEMITGTALSGGQGTTVSQVSKPILTKRAGPSSRIGSAEDRRSDSKTNEASASPDSSDAPPDNTPATPGLPTNEAGPPPTAGDSTSPEQPKSSAPSSATPGEPGAGQATQPGGLTP